MNLQLTDDDAFVLASCMANQLAMSGAIIAPDETQLLIAHLDRIEELMPIEKTAIFLARQDLIFGRHREAAVRICELLLGRFHRHSTGQITDPSDNCPAL